MTGQETGNWVAKGLRGLATSNVIDRPRPSSRPPRDSKFSPQATPVEKTRVGILKPWLQGLAPRVLDRRNDDESGRQEHPQELTPLSRTARRSPPQCWTGNSIHHSPPRKIDDVVGPPRNDLFSPSLKSRRGVQQPNNQSRRGVSPRVFVEKDAGRQQANEGERVARFVDTSVYKIIFSDKISVISYKIKCNCLIFQIKKSGETPLLLYFPRKRV